MSRLQCARGSLPAAAMEAMSTRAYMHGLAHRQPRVLWGCVMKTLANVMEDKADIDLEPQRRQRVVVDGHERLMLCCLDRTGVIELDGERLLVPLTRIQVRRPASLKWQPKEELRTTPAWITRRRYEAAQKKGRR